MTLADDLRHAAQQQTPHVYRVQVNGWTHALVGGAILLCGAASNLFMMQELAIEPMTSSIGALGLMSLAAWVHHRMSRKSRPRRRLSKPLLNAGSAKPLANKADIGKDDPELDDDHDANENTGAARMQPVSTMSSGHFRTGPGTAGVGTAGTVDANSEKSASLSTLARSDQRPGRDLAPSNRPATANVGQATETELERVERLVKRLADSVNNLETNATPAQPGIMSAGTAAGTKDTASDTDRQLAASISALKAAAEAMAQPTGQTAIAAPQPLAVEPPGQHWPAEWSTPQSPRFAPSRTNHGERLAILSAINAQRIDVFLEPILGLAEQRAEHYEVSIAMRTVDGNAINLAEAVSDLSGTGLLPLIEQARLSRAAQMARHLAERGKTGSILTELTSETLNDAGFKETFVETSRRVGAFPGQLVLALPQAHVVTFTTADWQTLGRLRAVGFHFALTDLISLDMDFTRLAEAGFVFARLDASIFLGGLPAEGGNVPPQDICRHLAASGLALVVKGIADDYQLAQIFGFGVVLGQGQLFGAPRPVKTAATQPAVVAAE